MSHAACAGKGRRLGCVANVCEEQVRRARGKHADGHVAVAQCVEQPRHGAIATGEHADIKVFGVCHSILGNEVRRERAERALVASVDEGTLELEYGIRAKT